MSVIDGSEVSVAMFRSLTTASLIIGVGIALAPVSDATPMLPTFKSCKQAHVEGVYNIPKGDPQYKKKQDKNHDGVACEGHPKGDKNAPADPAAPLPDDQPVQP